MKPTVRSDQGKSRHGELTHVRINGVDIMLAGTGSSDVGEDLAHQDLQNEGMPPVPVSDVAIHVRVLLRDAEK